MCWSKSLSDGALMGISLRLKVPKWHVIILGQARDNHVRAPLIISSLSHVAILYTSCAAR